MAEEHLHDSNICDPHKPGSERVAECVRVDRPTDRHYRRFADDPLDLSSGKRSGRSAGNECRIRVLTGRKVPAG